MKIINSFIFIFAILLFISGCGKKSEVITDKKTDVKTETNQTGKPDAELIKKGNDIFYSESKETGLKCADCHSDGTNTNNIETKFFAPIMGAAQRTSVYNGMYKGADVLKNACGGTECWKNYLKNETPLTNEQVNALNAYYISVSKGDEKEFIYTTIGAPTKDKTKLKEDQITIAALTGDAVKGGTLFKDACSFCHGKNSSVKKVPSLAENKEDVNMKSIIYHIRLGSKYMPFYSFESLTDQDVADICAFILNNNK